LVGSHVRTTSRVALFRDFASKREWVVVPAPSTPSTTMKVPLLPIGDAATPPGP
jgi:hypothetical protein